MMVPINISEDRFNILADLWLLQGYLAIYIPWSPFELNKAINSIFLAPYQ
jgi:hypothetical protein